MINTKIDEFNAMLRECEKHESILQKEHMDMIKHLKMKKKLALQKQQRKMVNKDNCDNMSADQDRRN